VPKKTDITPAPTPEIKPEQKPSLVIAASLAVASQYRIARFRGRAMLLEEEPYPHFVPLHKERFDRIAYPILGGLSRSKMSDIFSYLANTVEDLSPFDRYILFGSGTSNPQIWDTQELRFDPDVDPEQAIWRSPYAAATPAQPADHPRSSFVTSLAGGDEELYDDIMQSLAPLVMGAKPDGVIWWVGDGANGKSTLMDAIYKIFPGQLSSITVKRLTDGRDTPSLNGTLANVVKESSEGRIDDTEIYKAIGTHEDFRVHKFHSQDDITIRGNLHHIFSANTIPVFNDKGWSARRRTFVVPFTQRFESDPTFERRTFTPEMFGDLIAEMCRYAVRLHEQGYRYKWSAITLGAKEEYDTEANSAEEYAKALIAEGVVGFDNFTPVRQDYDNWCADHGYVALGVGNLRRAVQSAGFERISYAQENGKIGKHYRLRTVGAGDLAPLSVGRPGLYTVPGFAPEEPEVVSVKPIQGSILGGW
jgi:hypothetical protein